MTLSQEQLSAACDEARRQGLRTLVHAYREAVRAATIAGCSQIEHGTGATEEDLKLMAEKGGPRRLLEKRVINSAERQRRR